MGVAQHGGKGCLCIYDLYSTTSINTKCHMELRLLWHVFRLFAFHLVAPVSRVQTQIQNRKEFESGTLRLSGLSFPNKRKE